MSNAVIVCAERLVGIFNEGDTVADENYLVCVAANLDTFKVHVPSDRIERMIEKLRNVDPEVEITDYRDR